MTTDFHPLYPARRIKSGVIGIGLVTLLVISGCERPSSPDFETDHKLDVPLVQNARIDILGGSSALIDTTSEDFEDLINYNGDGLVRLSSEIDDFNVGDFDDAIPELDIEGQTFSSEIGVIEIDDFEASFQSEIGVLEAEPKDFDAEPAELGNTEIDFEAEGETDFETITNSDPSNFPPNTHLPAGEANDIIIDIDEDSFEQAVMENGEIVLTLTNNLGFDLSEVNLQLLSGGTAPEAGDGVAVGNPVIFEDGIDHNQTADETLVLHQGEVLEQDLALRADFEWEDQTMQDHPDNLVVETVGEEFIVQQATARIPAQEIDIDSDVFTLGDESFEFARLEDSGAPGDVNRLTIEFENNTELPVTNSNQTDTPVLTLLNDNGDVLDQPRNLVPVQDPNADRIEPGETAAATFDLNGEYITREITYELDAGTEGGDPLTVDASDDFLIDGEMGELRVVESRSDVDPQSDIHFEDEVTIEGDFTDAEVEEGELIIEMTNDTEIPITVEQLEFYNAESFRAKNTGHFFAAGSEIATLENVDIPARETVTETIDISGRGISSTIAYDGTGSSPGTGGEQVLINSEDQLLTEIYGAITVSSADAVIQSQSISTQETIDFDTDNFTFESDDDYVDMKDGAILLSDLINNIDLDVDTLQISFPTIYKVEDGVYHPDDTLTALFAGEDRIRRSSDGEVRNLEIPLAGHRIIATGNELTYNIYGVTEDTRDHPQGDTLRTINSEDDIQATLEIENLQIGEASGMVEPRTVLLNDDVNGDGTLDIFNDDQAEVTEFDGFDFGGLDLDEIEVLNSELNLTYSTNLEAESHIYALIAAVKNDGETVYLSGKPGTEFEVSETDTVSGFYAHGSPVSHDQLIRFPVEGPAEKDQPKTISFSSENSNVDELLSTLPEEIRFVGKTLVNPNQNRVTIVDPITFEPGLGIDIPLNIATPENPVTYSSSTDADLQELESFEELEEAALKIRYENSIPLQAQLYLDFLDEQGEVITSLPLDEDQRQKMQLRSAPVDPDTRFSSESHADIFEISLTQEQIRELPRTDSLHYTIELSTSEMEEVKLHRTDGLDLSIGGSFRFRTKIN